MVPCPECDALNKRPAPDTKKITCSNCGCIIISKLLEPQADTPSVSAKPTIRKRTRGSGGTEAGEEGGTRRTTGRRRTTAGRRVTASRRRTVADDDGQPADDRPAGGRPRGKSKQNIPPAILWGSLVLLVVAAVAGIIAFSGGNDEEPVTPQKGGTESADAGTGAATEAGDATTATDATNPAGETSEKKPATAKPTKKPPTVRKYGKNWTPTPYGNPKDATPEEIEGIKKNIETVRDLKATRTLGIARNELEKTPKKAIPLLINALMACDITNKDDSARGWQVIQTLQMVSSTRTDYDRDFHPMEWKDPTGEEGVPLLAYRKKAVTEWCKWWDKNAATWKPLTDDDDF